MTVKKSDLRLGMSPVSNKIYAGRLNKNKTLWVGEKKDVTDSFYDVLFQFIPPSNVRTIDSFPGAGEKKTNIFINCPDTPEGRQKIIDYLTKRGGAPPKETPEASGGKKSRPTEIIKIGEVGVDSAKLILCDPQYIDNHYKKRKESANNSMRSRHDIMRHAEDGSLWQYVDRGFGRQLVSDVVPDIKPFPGTYSDIIPEYGMSPNELIDKGIFVDSGHDPMAHIKAGEFSRDGIFKSILHAKDGAVQLNYSDGKPGMGVVFTSGYGDGIYEVFAEIVDTGFAGRRVKKVWVELLEDNPE